MRYKMRFFRYIKNIIRSSYLSIRFPFLYPKNRWTGHHYDNWTIVDWKDKVFNKYHAYCFADDLDKVKANNKVYFLVGGPKLYFYWKNPWACFLHKTLEFINNKFLQIFHFIPSYNELDRMPKGWRKAFGIQMCKDIKEALLKKGGRKLLRRYRIIDIKEKYGELRWYDNGSFKELEDIIDKYADLSAKTCIVCGKPAVWMTDYRDWASPYCDDCVPELAKERAEIIA